MKPSDYYLYAFLCQFALIVSGVFLKTALTNSRYQGPRKGWAKVGIHLWPFSKAFNEAYPSATSKDIRRYRIAWSFAVVFLVGWLSFFFTGKVASRRADERFKVELNQAIEEIRRQRSGQDN